MANYATVPSDRKLYHGFQNATILVGGEPYWNNTGDDLGFGVNEVSESSRGEGVHHVKVVSKTDPDNFIEATFNFVLADEVAPDRGSPSLSTTYDIGRFTGVRQVDASRQEISTTEQLVAAFKNSGGGRYYLRGGVYTPNG